MRDSLDEALLRQMGNKCTVQDCTEKIQKQNCIKINTLLLA